MVRRDENKRGAGGDLVKNGVVKHSTHIVSRLFTLPRIPLLPKREYSRLLSILSAACQTPFFNFRLSLISREKNAVVHVLQRGYASDGFKLVSSNKCRLNPSLVSIGLVLQLLSRRRRLKYLIIIYPTSFVSFQDVDF